MSFFDVRFAALYSFAELAQDPCRLSSDPASLMPSFGPLNARQLFISRNAVTVLLFPLHPNEALNIQPELDDTDGKNRMKIGIAQIVALND